MWLPLIAVIVVLGLLAAAPVLVSLHARRLRTVISDVIDPARLRATDLSASLSKEMFAVGMQSGTGRASEDAFYQKSLQVEHGDAFALDSLLRFANAGAVEQFAQYREAATRWHDDVDAMRQGPAGAADRDTARTDGVAALAATSRLSDGLEQVGVAARDQVRSAEQLDVLLPAAVVPLALLACVLLVRAGRRTVDIAVRAERNRHALAQAMEQKSAFMRGISHDLQNPLSAALGYIELSLDGYTKPEEQRDTLARVRRLVSTASETVGSLLSLAQSEAGEIRLDARSIELCALVRAAIEDHAPVVRTRHQSIAFTGPSECRATGDAGRVRHIVDNLLSNASKYTQPGGHIRASVARRRRGGRTWSVVIVEDSGPGIPPDWRERVFEEFARVPGTSDIAPGNGIGLAVSRRVARLMGGDITLGAADEPSNADSPLGGAVFILWLVAGETGSAA